MPSRRHHLSTVLAGALVALAAGCGTASPLAVLPTSNDAPLSLAAVDPESTRVARSQRPEPEPPAAPAPQEQPRPSAVPALPTPPASSLPTPAAEEKDPSARGQFSVRALVNGKPIFDDDVIGAVSQRLPELAGKGREQQIAHLETVFKFELDQMVERELLLQDAYRKLEKNEKFLDKLKAAAAKEFDKQNKQRAKKLGITYEQLKNRVLQLQGKESWEVLRRQAERVYIATQYIHSRIAPIVQNVNLEDIYEHYQQHASEYRTVDRVKWQDIFIVVGPNHPTMADARQFAEQILDRARHGQPFDEFLRFDEGDSWTYRKGEGNGQMRGEIRPPELEQYLFAMREGEVGPPVELSTGVHVFRVLKREYEGQMPFSEQLQLRIGNQIKGEIAQREYKRLVKELRERAVIEIVPGFPWRPGNQDEREPQPKGEKR